ncbi:MAG TPA: hypothetical protein VMW41_04645 [Candidatus Bathyarchaeia archaeon]|nr:hypothetical protein [Candidatus Bathyarchaeia archaeon]
MPEQTQLSFPTEAYREAINAIRNAGENNHASDNGSNTVIPLLKMIPGVKFGQSAPQAELHDLGINGVRATVVLASRDSDKAIEAIVHLIPKSQLSWITITRRNGDAQLRLILIIDEKGVLSYGLLLKQSRQVDEKRDGPFEGKISDRLTFDSAGNISHARVRNLALMPDQHVNLAYMISRLTDQTDLLTEIRDIPLESLLEESQ